jgi:hypothetical protein
VNDRRLLHGLSTREKVKEDIIDNEIYGQAVKRLATL